jgi:3-hydroxyisobutyrate dehydrogenase-like beta-hydroxyacid dehydrogenase
MVLIHNMEIIKIKDSGKLMQFNKVLVMGLGQLGLPVAKYVKDRGFDVYGYDISTKALERAEKTAGIKKAIGFSGFDVYIHMCFNSQAGRHVFTSNRWYTVNCTR